MEQVAVVVAEGTELLDLHTAWGSGGQGKRRINVPRGRCERETALRGQWVLWRAPCGSGAHVYGGARLGAAPSAC